MSRPLRVAGWGTLDDGAAVTWTIAEGRRGRRWREVVARDEAVRHSLLLETAVDGRFSHLELARAGGLWTFHPEPDGTLHGNHVDPDGRTVRHVEGLPFAPDDLLIIEGSPLGAAAVAWRLAGAVQVGASLTARRRRPPGGRRGRGGRVDARGAARRRCLAPWREPAVRDRRRRDSRPRRPGDPATRGRLTPLRRLTVDALWTTLVENAAEPGNSWISPFPRAGRAG